MNANIPQFSECASTVASTQYQIRAVTKYYGKTCDIANLTFEVNEGECFGFLGPNGAGTTTTKRIAAWLAGLSLNMGRLSAALVGLLAVELIATWSAHRLYRAQPSRAHHHVE